MKRGNIVTVGETEGKVVWIDKPWELPNGENADILIRVTFDKDEEGKYTGHGKWLRQSICKLK